MAFENLGDQLIGAGAGFQGRGVEFNAQLQNQRRQQEQDRQRQEQQKRQAEQQRLTTLFTDANAGLNFAKQGRFDLVNNLAGQRLEDSKNFPGVDFNDTQNIFDLSQSAAAGDAVAQQELISTLDDAVLQGRAIGVLETPQGLTEKQRVDLDIAKAKLNKLRSDSTSGADAENRSLRERELTLKESAERRQSTKLSAGLEQELLNSQDKVVLAQRNANEYTVLADDFERLNLEGGVTSSFSETLKGILGTQDDVTEFRRRFNKVRLSEGLKNLPPGPATDRDVQEAFKGVPKDNASAEQVASFLRGAARLARFEAGFNQFKADFISDKRSAAGLNKEWRKRIKSPALNKKVSIAEIYETAQNKGITPEDVMSQLGIQ